MTNAPMYNYILTARMGELKDKEEVKKYLECVETYLMKFEQYAPDIVGMQAYFRPHFKSKVDSSGNEWAPVCPYDRHMNHPNHLPFGHPYSYYVCPNCGFHATIDSNLDNCHQCKNSNAA
jgi:hypothetical protein